MIRPTIFTVLTLGVIGTWQIFDQIYVGTQGSPASTTLTPAFLSFNASFNSSEWGVGAAVAFILFAIIVFFTVVTRLADPRQRPLPRRRRVRPPLGTASDARASTPGAAEHRRARVRRRTAPDARSRTASSPRSRSSTSSRS